MSALEKIVVSELEKGVLGLRIERKKEGRLGSEPRTRAQPDPALRGEVSDSSPAVDVARFGGGDAACSR